MTNPTDRLGELKITLPVPPERAGLYTYCKFFGNNLAYVSGCGPAIEGEPALTGKVGAELTPEQGWLAARRCVLNALSVLRKNLGDLSRVACVAKILVFVASADDFYRQPEVANGASQVLMDVFGEEAGCPARSAIGVNVLPGNIPVEVEMLVALKE